jgi:hypothetical protein
MKNIAFAFLTTILLFACSGPDHTKTFKLENIEFVYSGPLFEGSNAAQYVAKIDLKEILGADYQDGMEIDEASLKKAFVEITEPKGCTDINSFVMSLASDNPDLAMQELAVVNPIKSYGGQIKLKPSPSADATDYFAEKSVYVVLDASFLKDVDANVLVKGNFEFELKY